MVYVIKFDGRREKFDRNKIIKTCLRVDLSPSEASEIARSIEERVYDGITTREIYQMILKEIEKYNKGKSCIYRLREAISKILPHAFEIFVKRLLENCGFVCEHHKIIQGWAVDHEVDIVAKRGNELFLVECKHHINFHRFCGLDVALQVQARLEDLIDGYKHGKNKYPFTKAWIFTNSKFSEHAIRYAKVKGIELTGWKYPSSGGIEKLIQENRIFPITLLKMKKSIMNKLMENDIVVLQDLSEKKLRKVGLKEKAIRNILEQKNKLACS